MKFRKIALFAALAAALSVGAIDRGEHQAAVFRNAGAAGEQQIGDVVELTVRRLVVSVEIEDGRILGVRLGGGQPPHIAKREPGEVVRRRFAIEHVRVLNFGPVAALLGRLPVVGEFF